MEYCGVTSHLAVVNYIYKEIRVSYTICNLWTAEPIWM